jgi:hypothetical protein
MSDRTRFLNRLLGLYCIIAGAVMGLQREATLGAVTLLIHDRPLMFIAGVIMLFAGLAMVLLHNQWSGGVATIIVTIIGWLTLLKASLFLLLPPGAADDFYLGILHFGEWYYAYAALSLILGLYLAVAGFSVKNPRR